MIRNTLLRTLIITACICSFFSFIPNVTQAQTKEKVGILFINVGGGDWNYSADWIPGFFNNLWGIFDDGFHTGGWIGHADDQLQCYTQVHYANAEEAAGCGCDEGTLIDVLCNEYADGTAVHTISEYGPDGDGSFSTDCYPGFGLPYTMQSSADWNSTIDPTTGDLIVAPVLDPDSTFNPGQGIPEFHESIAWTRFGYLAEVPNGYDPSKRDWKKWWYGNEADCLDDPNCGPDATELSNVKDSILSDSSLTDRYDFVFRHGWEGRMRNQDARGDTLAIPYPDSTETAIQELIVDEGVDRIVILHTQPAFANVSQYGDEWKQKNFRYDPVDGEPVSRVSGKTYKQCIEELDDDYGPGWTLGTVHEPEERDLYLAEKPWENRPLNPWPDIVEMVDSISASEGVDVDLQFAPSFGIFDEFSESVLNNIEYTVSSFGVPADTTASLAIVLVDHGYHGAHRDSATCDAWFTENEAMFERVESYILDSSLPGQFSKFKVVRGAGEYAEGHYSTSDKPSAEKPFGDVMSMGEQIDDAINGIYVNSQGEIIDNGDDNYEYIIAVPYFFEGFSSDYHEKKETLGSMTDENGNGIFERDHNSPDGDSWGPHDYVDYVDEESIYDGEYAVTVVMDQTVFASCASEASATTIAIASASEEGSACTIVAYKGSATNPTTVIIPGPALSLPDAIGVRENLVAAVHKTVNVVLDDPPTIDGGPLVAAGPWPVLPTDPDNPMFLGQNYSILWAFSDDYVECSGPCTHTAEYQEVGDSTWTALSIDSDLISDWYAGYELPVETTLNNATTYAVRFTVTDCASQSTQSGLYYFRVVVTDNPPVLESGPFLAAGPWPIFKRSAETAFTLSENYDVVWTFSDDYAFCEDGPCTHRFKYRKVGTETWTRPTPIEGQSGETSYAYLELPITSLENGTYQFNYTVLDCLGQKDLSHLYYFKVEKP